MEVVKNLTKTGITICATIHNPTPYCFNLFDRLMILLHGRVVYSGDNGACAYRKLCAMRSNCGRTLNEHPAPNDVKCCESYAILLLHPQATSLPDMKEQGHMRGGR
jgi:ABC-type multidrug transport system ATPase subunit